VVLGLAFGGFAVMAGKAALADFCVINMNLRPIHIVVAGGAFIAGCRMGERFALGHCVVVAAHACRRHALENAALVAGFAGDLNVHALQREARGLVVEILIDFESRVGRRGHRLGWRGGRLDRCRDRQ